ncbi:MAG: glycine-rich domain-containing protein-like [Gammaproteobacteria bacterium]|nr:glycine-rich domain-containing protein-like [Gammaproteobacteria bacterium]
MNQGIVQSSINLDAFIQQVYSLDLSTVLDRLVNVENWHTKAAQTAIMQYRNFLILKKKYGDHYILPPSHEIDEVWHAHILHTEEYSSFCTKIYGCFLHHHPHLGKEARSLNELTQLFEQTQALYYQEFGGYIEAISKRGYRQKIRSLFNLK